MGPMWEPQTLPSKGQQVPDGIVGWIICEIAHSLCRYVGLLCASNHGREVEIRGKPAVQAASVQKEIVDRSQLDPFRVLIAFFCFISDFPHLHFLNFRSHLVLRCYCTHCTALCCLYTRTQIIVGVGHSPLKSALS